MPETKSVVALPFQFYLDAFSGPGGANWAIHRTPLIYLNFQCAAERPVAIETGRSVVIQEHVVKASIHK
jgi:hypothetical protein